MCNYVKFETGQNLLPVLKIVTHTTRCVEMLMLLSVHMTSVLFLVQFNNFALITGFIGAIHSYSIRPFLWALGHQSNCIPVGDGLYTQFTGPFPCFVKVLGLACETRAYITS